MRETTRPIVSLAFILPLIFFYELGSIFTDQLSRKSGIDQWIHRLMESAGVGHLVVLPLVTIAALLTWHHQLEDQWRVKPRILLGMWMESLGLGVILFLAGHAVYQVIYLEMVQPVLAIPGASIDSWWYSTIAYIGCGVYEELIFRLLLLNGLIYLGGYCCDRRRAVYFAILLTSILFATLHIEFLDPVGIVFDANAFIYRFFASVIFCVLFLYRGFGIAAGTHCIYDVITQL